MDEMRACRGHHMPCGEGSMLSHTLGRLMCAREHRYWKLFWQQALRNSTSAHRQRLNVSGHRPIKSRTAPVRTDEGQNLARNFSHFEPDPLQRGAETGNRTGTVFFSQQEQPQTKANYAKAREHTRSSSKKHCTL